MISFDEMLDAGRSMARCAACGDESGAGEPCSERCAELISKVTDENIYLRQDNAQLWDDVHKLQDELAALRRLYVGGSDE